MPLNNLLQDLQFGATIQSQGKQYTVVARLTDRIFAVIPAGAQLPQPMMLAEVDILMNQGTMPQAGGAAPAGPAGTGGGPPPSDDPPPQGADPESETKH